MDDGHARFHNSTTRISIGAYAFSSYLQGLSDKKTLVIFTIGVYSLPCASHSIVRGVESPAEIDPKGHPVTHANDKGCRKDCQDA